MGGSQYKLNMFITWYLYQFSIINCFMLYVLILSLAIRVSKFTMHLTQRQLPALSPPPHPDHPSPWVHCTYSVSRVPRKKNCHPPPNPSIRPPLVHFSVPMGGVSRRDIADIYDIISVHYSEQRLH